MTKNTVVFPDAIIAIIAALYRQLGLTPDSHWGIEKIEEDGATFVASFFHLRVEGMYDEATAEVVRVTDTYAGAEGVFEMREWRTRIHQDLHREWRTEGRECVCGANNATKVPSHKHLFWCNERQHYDQWS